MRHRIFTARGLIGCFSINLLLVRHCNRFVHPQSHRKMAATNGTNGHQGQTSLASQTPLDMLGRLLAEPCFVKCRNGRELSGKLHAYDEHLNVLMGDVQEKTFPSTSTSTSSSSAEAVIRQMDMLYVRGDAITMITRQ
mmetsp:Transcript_26389/g.66559  ORF Transcript_26389/g.66559 Transcript_26389/m.66559 type:complete len:138 (+) Transcript_26389:648-1061(+)